MKLWSSIDLRKRPSRTILRLIAIHVSIVLLVCLSGLGQTTTGRAQEGVTVRPDPLSLVIGTGSTGTVNILVEDVTDLYGFELEITFDPTLIEVVDADLNKEGVQIQPGDLLSPDWFLDNTVGNDSGIITYALSQMNPSPPQSGDGVLAIITWRGKTVGTSPIVFTYAHLGAPRGVPIPANAQDGEIVIVSAEIVPASNPTSTAAPASNLTPTAAPAEPPTTSLPPTPTPLTMAVLEATDLPTITPNSPAGSSRIPISSLACISFTCLLAGALLLAAALGAWAVWRQRQ